MPTAPSFRSTLTSALHSARVIHLSKRVHHRPLRTFTSSSLARNASRSADSTQQHDARSATPDAATRLLLDTIPSIPRYGFTQQAYLSASSSQSADEAFRRTRIVSTLFPGPESHFSAQLFLAWSNTCDLAVVHRVSPETVLERLKTGQPVASSSSAVQLRSSLSAAEEKSALAKVAQTLENRLRLSWDIRQHLTHGIASLCTLSPTATAAHSVFPHQTILPNLPNPLPLLELTRTFVDTVLTEAETGWVDADGTDWYAVRMRLTAAYTAAMLHAASTSTVHFEESRRVLRRLVEGRESGVVAMAGEVAGRVGEWTRWGGRGWLGVLRSLGL